VKTSNDYGRTHAEEREGGRARGKRLQPTLKRKSDIRGTEEATTLLHGGDNVSFGLYSCRRCLYNVAEGAGERGRVELKTGATEIVVLIPSVGERGGIEMTGGDSRRRHPVSGKRHCFRKGPLRGGGRHSEQNKG